MVNLTCVHSAHVSFAASGSGGDSLTDEVVEVSQLILFSEYHQSQKRDKITRKIAGEKPKILSVLSFSYVDNCTNVSQGAEASSSASDRTPQVKAKTSTEKQKHPLERKKHLDKKSGLLRSLIVENFTYFRCTGR